MTANDKAILDATQAWFNRAVLGLNLCPFAHAPARNNSIRWQLLQHSTPSYLLDVLTEEIERLHQHSEAELTTTVLISPSGLEDFEDYLDVLSFLEEWLDEAGHTSFVQLASFHPHYQFEDIEENARENWTNRAPYPLFHLIREDSITKAIDAGADTDAIPNRNMETISELTEHEMRDIFPHFEN